jgi:Golgi phosphoprotein 3 GPP34
LTSPRVGSYAGRIITVHVAADTITIDLASGDTRIVQQVAPDTRTAALITLVHAVGCVDKVVDPRQHGLSKRDLRARAEAIAEGNGASEAVRKTIEQMMAAVVAATTATTIATPAGVQASTPAVDRDLGCGALDAERPPR